MTEYRTVDTSTLAGQAEAEQLHEDGWECYRTGLYLMYFKRRK